MFDSCAYVPVRALQEGMTDKQLNKMHNRHRQLNSIWATQKLKVSHSLNPQICTSIVGVKLHLKDRKERGHPNSPYSLIGKG